jgi:hypothetical protein
MAPGRPPRKANALTDDFQRAANVAENKAGSREWLEMTPTERARAIYAELRQIDAARVAAMSFVSKSAASSQAAVESTRRMAAD